MTESTGGRRGMGPSFSSWLGRSGVCCMRLGSRFRAVCHVANESLDLVGGLLPVELTHALESPCLEGLAHTRIAQTHHGRSKLGRVVLGDVDGGCIRRFGDRGVV